MIARNGLGMSLRCGLGGDTEVSTGGNTVVKGFQNDFRGSENSLTSRMNQEVSLRLISYHEVVRVVPVKSCKVTVTSSKNILHVRP